MRRKLTKLTAALLGALLVCSGMSGMAHAAAPESLPPESGSLTIHKYLMDDVGQAEAPNNGHEAGTNGNPSVTAGATALEGVTFGVWKINTTYDTNGNLTSPVKFPETAAEAEEMLDAGTLTMAKIGDYTTGADGSVKISDLERGYYYVKELRSKHTAIATAVEPFLVAVPMTDASAGGDNASWITDVHVYPKNSPLENSKVVNDEMVSTGEYYEQDNTLNWKINTDIPSNIGDAAESITNEGQETQAGGYFRIVDKLDPSFTYTANSLHVYAGMTRDAQTAELTADTDYKLYVGTRTSDQGTTITVDVTQEGMRKLAAGAAGVPYSNLFITFDTTLDADAAQNTAIKNVPETYFSADPGSDPGDPEDPEDPTPDPQDPPDPTIPPDEEIPYVVVGSIVLQKVTGDGATPLQGAEFKIATSEANAQNGTFLKVNGTGDDVVATSDVDGTVTFTNLPLTPQFDDGGTFTGFAEEAYWLVETKAPAGYNLLPTPIKVPVLDNIAENEQDQNGNLIAGHIQFTEGTDRINSVEFKIVNTSSFTLPRTGGIGTVLFTVGGIVLMGTAVILLVTRRRKTDR